MRVVMIVTLLIVLLPGIGVAKETAQKNKKVVYRKTQKVDFEEATVDGAARTPDAAYLHQRRGVDFVPLYKVRQQFEKETKASLDYVK